MSARKFYRTVVSITVLSDEPLPSHWDLVEIAYDIIEGESVGYHLKREQEVLSKKQVCAALYEAGSDPSFFNLTA
jgi:hypothetical protein